MTEMITINVNGVDSQVAAGQQLITAAAEAGTFIPHFCHHDRMEPVGQCRTCLVEVEGPRGTMLVPSCTMPVSDGMVVHTNSPTVKKAVEAVMEFTLINHPLDCPICDKAGECPLQDQVLSHGPGESRFVEQKRHFEKPIPISELVLLDRERCILCSRCVRFGEEISGDPLLEFIDRGNDTQVNTFADNTFASYYSGNVVQICPVGALTSTAYRFKARSWDLDEVTSVCGHCTVGESVTVQSSHNKILRVDGLDNEATNHGWLNDKCRYGFEWVGSGDRLKMPMVKGADGAFHESSWGEALGFIADQLISNRDMRGGSSIGAVGGARGTNEDAYALSKFMRTVLGSNNVDARLDDTLNAEFLAGFAGKGQIADLESAKTILVWAADLKEEHSTLYLRVYRAATALGAKLIVVNPMGTGLDDVATHSFTYPPGSGDKTLADLMSGTEQFAAARVLLDDGPVVALVGKAGTGESPFLAESVAAFVRDLDGASVLPLARRSNTFGALDMGLAPALLPGRVTLDDAHLLADAWGEIPTDRGLDTAGMLKAAAEGELKVMLLVGADPVADTPDGAGADSALANLDFLVSIDCFMNASNAHADVVLPALGFAEKEGTVTNLEGRVMKANRAVTGPGQARADWSILDDLSTRMRAPLGFGSAEAVSTEIANTAPAYQGITWFLLDWKERLGVIAPRGDAQQPLQYVPVITDSDTAVKGDFIVHSARKLYDAGTLAQAGPSLAGLAAEPFVALNPADAKSIGANGHVEIEGTTVALKRDASVPVGTIFVPFNQPSGPRVGVSTSVSAVAEVDAG
jgi:NADH-quinone oxidoreductase subunit G